MDRRSRRMQIYSSMLAELPSSTYSSNRRKRRHDDAASNDTTSTSDLPIERQIAHLQEDPGIIVLDSSSESSTENHAARLSKSSIVTSKLIPSLQKPGATDHAQSPAQEDQDIDDTGDDADDSDFEDVDIGSNVQVEVDRAGTQQDPPRRGQRRVATRAELEKQRLIHQFELICLSLRGSLYARASADSGLQQQLREMVPSEISIAVAAVPTGRQTARSFRSNAFRRGIKLLAQFLKTQFRMSSRARADGNEYPDDRNASPIAGKNAFSLKLINDEIKAALDLMRGSRSELACLLNAAIMALNEQSRLVFSLQACPLSTVSKITAATTTQTNTASPKCKDISGQYVLRRREDSSSDDDLEIDRLEDEIAAAGLIDGGRNSSTSARSTKDENESTSANVLSRPKHIGLRPAPLYNAEEIAAAEGYPLIWIEVFDRYLERWIPVDISVSLTIDDAYALEPKNRSAQYPLNYAFAFDIDGAAYDVTLRYCKQFNAKTRKRRIDNTREGQTWLARLLTGLAPRRKSAANEIDSEYLCRRQLAEKMPSNVLDFKDHILYALERHLARNEVILPGTVPIGYVRVGRGKSEPVYPRDSVRIVKSAKNWYLLGRIVKKAEQAVKSATRRGRDGDARSIALYLEEQTECYDPGTVHDGIVPKRSDKSIDLFVSDMLPRGAVHISHPLSQYIARVLDIDFAVAVVAEDYKHKRGYIRRKNGIVCAKEYEPAVNLAIEAREQQLEDELQRVRDLHAISRWRQLVIKLQVLARVNQHRQDIA